MAFLFVRYRSKLELWMKLSRKARACLLEEKIFSSPSKSFLSFIFLRKSASWKNFKF